MTQPCCDNSFSVKKKCRKNPECPWSSAPVPWEVATPLAVLGLSGVVSVRPQRPQVLRQEENLVSGPPVTPGCAWLGRARPPPHGASDRDSSLCPTPGPSRALPGPGPGAQRLEGGRGGEGRARRCRRPCSLRPRPGKWPEKLPMCRDPQRPSPQQSPDPQRGSWGQKQEGRGGRGPPHLGAPAAVWWGASVSAYLSSDLCGLVLDSL